MEKQNAQTTAGSKKKSLEVVSAGNGMLKIQWENGGEVPVILHGYFTDYTVAKQNIDNYIAHRK